MLRLTHSAAVLAAAQAVLAERIDRMSRPERGWTMANWATRMQREVDDARTARDDAAAEYRADVVATRRALAGRAADAERAIAATVTAHGGGHE